MTRHAAGGAVRAALLLSSVLSLAACSDEAEECKPACGAGSQCVEGACQPSADGGIGGGADAGTAADATPSDATPADATPSDAAGGDAARADATPTDASPSDAAPVDGAGLDAGQPDGELPSDAGTPAEDAGPPDLGVPDAGFLPVVVGLTLTPTSARLVSVDGSRPEQVFALEALWDDGSTSTPTTAVWRLDPITLGTVSATTSRFVANGRVGGQVTLIVEYAGATARAPITVALEQTVLVAGTSTVVPALFSGNTVTDPMREADIAYPLDGAVMPQNVAPAVVQWRRSAVGDAFRITLSKPNVQVLAYYAVASDPSFRRSWEVELAGWRRIAQSEPSAWADIRVDRWQAATGEVILGTPVRVRFAEAALLGSIYYWDIARGRIVRIDDGTGNRVEFMPTPQQNCIGCHAVSTSGRYMAGRLGGGDNVGTVYDLTRDLSTNPPPTVFTMTPTTARWFFATWNPADDRLLISQYEQGAAANRRLALQDPFTGEYVTPVSGSLPTGPVTHPAWAPDDSAIAYVGDTNAWGGTNTTGNLYLLPILGRDAFGTPVRVLTATTPSGTPRGAAASYPSWSPDAEWIAFAHGTGSRSDSHQSALYIMRRSGSDLVRLDRACAGASTTDNFQPRFSPFVQDGYFWMSFLSRRDYGNELAGTAGRRRQQIWVSAVKINPAPGEDPSEVAFWLPGQNTASQNISAYWAPRACLDVADPCAVDAECCTGECSPSGLCEPPTACREPGQACTDNVQCCGALLCVGGTCGGL